MRLDDEKLERLGVDHPNHRYELLNEILKQVIIFVFFQSRGPSIFHGSFGFNLFV